MDSGSPTRPVDAAGEYLQRGWAPIPVPHRSKAPVIRDWQHLCLSADALPGAFPRAELNIGVLLGAPSQGLIDVDLDTPHSRRLAVTFLPATGAVFGRRSSPASHWLYKVTGEISTIRFQDISAASAERATLLECRSTGTQTLVPPSVHPSGEPVEWQRHDAPGTVTANALRQATSSLAAATLLARRWPEGSRHDATLALASGLLRAGWSRDLVETFILAVADAAGDDELEDRRRAVQSTVDAYRTGARTVGWPRLGAIIGESTIDQARRWLGIRSTAERPSPTTVPPPLAPVPPFPVEALPPLAREFVVTGAAALGCPPDFIVPHLFAFTGAIAGSSRRIELKPGFELTPIFWVGVIGKPGTVKSPALAYARGPIQRLQQDAWSRYQDAVKIWEQDKAAERSPRPQPEHFFATDTTTEAVASALMRSRGIAVIHDELAGWVNAFDAYRKAGDRQTWLSAWSGTPLKPNRKTGDHIYVSDPVACVLGGIQPDVLPTLSGEAARDDGFVPRLLLCWPDAEPSLWTDRSVPAELVNHVTDHLRHLRLPGDLVRTTRLDPEATVTWASWYDENQGLLTGAHGLTAGWGAKASVHLARIALVLHLLALPPSRPGEPEPLLSRSTLEDAITVLEYYRAHLDRVLPAFGTPHSGGRAGLAARVRRALGRSGDAWVGRADLAVRLGGHESADSITGALDALASNGDVERRTIPTGGRPREEWRLVSPSGQHQSGYSTGQSSVDDDPWADSDRDKGNDATRGRPELHSPSSGFSRTHVIPFERQKEVDGNLLPGWERWEEGE